MALRLAAAIALGERWAKPRRSECGNSPRSHCVGRREQVRGGTSQPRLLPVTAAAGRSVPPSGESTPHGSGGRRQGAAASVPAAPEAEDVHLPNPIKLSQLQVLWAITHYRSRERGAAAAKRRPYWAEVLVRRLEQTLGVLLFKGNPSDSARYAGHLSDAGQLMLHYSEQILLLAHEAQVALADLNQVRIGTLRLGACPTASAALAPQLAARFLAKHPTLDLEFKHADAQVVCAAIAAGHLDCGLIAQELPPEVADSLQSAQVAQEPLLLVLSPSHPQASRCFITLEELYRLDLCAFAANLGEGAAYAPNLQAAGVSMSRLKMRRLVGSLEAVRSLVAAGVGGAFLPASAVRDGIDAGRLVHLPVEHVEPVASISVVTNPGRYCSQAQRLLLLEAFDARIVCRLEGELSLQDERLLNLLPLAQHGCELQLAGSEGAPGPDGDDKPAAPRVGRPRRARLEWEPVTDAMLESCGMQRPLTDRSHWARRMALPIAQPSPDVVRPLPFTLKDLELFEAVSESKTLIETAAAFKMTGSAFSICITRLSKAFDTELTVKEHEGSGRQDVVFTDSGHLLHYYAKRIMRFAREALKAMEDVRDVKTGTVSLGASQTTGTYLMPRLIGMFRDRNPEVNVQLQVGSSRQICAAVEAGEVDVAIVGGEVPKSMQTQLVATPYAMDELVLIVPSQHPLASVKMIDKEDLFQLSFVTVNQDSSVQAVQASTLEQHGIKWSQLNIAMEFNSVEAIKSAVRCNLGVAFVSTSSIDKEVELGLVARVSIRGLRMLRTLFLVSNPRSYVSPAAREFMVNILQMHPAARPSGVVGGEVRLPSHLQSPRPWEMASRPAARAHLDQEHPKHSRRDADPKNDGQE